MFLLSFLRVIKFSFQDIIRNIWLSLITIVIISLALFSVNLLVIVKVLTSATVNAVKEKVDISLYLKPDSSEEAILALKIEIENLNSAKQVNYISKQAAIESFRKNIKTILKYCKLFWSWVKPFITKLNKAKNIDNYDELLSILNKIDNQIIESRNFDDHKAIFNKINSISQKANEASLFISLLFIFITH